MCNHSQAAYLGLQEREGDTPLVLYNCRECKTTISRETAMEEDLSLTPGEINRELDGQIVSSVIVADKVLRIEFDSGKYLAIQGGVFIELGDPAVYPNGIIKYMDL